MSVTATTPATTTTKVTKAAVKPLLRDGLIATAVAPVATATVAAVGDVAGISLDVAGAPIPATGFAVLTAFFSVVGLALTLVLNRFARRPRTAFVRTTVVLTVLSLVPDVLADAAVSTEIATLLKVPRSTVYYWR